jgi:hypothetical protein
MPDTQPSSSSPASSSAAPEPRPFRVNLERLQPGITIPRALAYMAAVGLAVLFLWLTLSVDLVIFGGVLFAISLRRAAEALSRLTRLPVGSSLLGVVLLILAFLSAMAWFFSQSMSRPPISKRLRPAFCKAFLEWRQMSQGSSEALS